jgi:hypothetical protein
MAESEPLFTEPPRQTAGHFMFFLDWAEKKGELPAATVQNWRGAATKVLEIEESWQDINVVDFDLEAHLRRFETLRRTAYTTGSMAAYKSRARTGIEAYRAWESGASGWKPKNAGATRAPRNGSKQSVSTPTPPPADTGIEKRETAGFVPHHEALIEYQLALRPGVRALLTLPELLTKNEAVRIIRFIRGLAIIDRDEETDEQLMITSGEGLAE